MSLSTANKYGKISITDDVIAKIANHVTSESYGVAGLVPIRFSDSIMMLFNKEPATKGVKLVTIDNRVFVDIYALVKAGVNKEAVVESLQSAVKYNVERFSGMRVKSVNAHVVGTKL